MAPAKPSTAPLSPLRTALLSLLLLIPAVSAQVGTLLDHSKLPSCAFSCQTLLNAQVVCVPPAAPVSSQTTYQSCFCQSGYLTTFKTSAYDICSGACSTTALGQIQQWYAGLCAPGAPVVTPVGNGDSTTQPTTTAAGSTATGTGSAARKKTGGPSWISTHYRWLIMIIVLLLAAAGFTFLGLYLKRRSRRANDSRHRESTLGLEDAAASVRSRHPEPSAARAMAQLPSWERGSQAMSSREMVAGTPPPTGAVRHYSGGSWSGGANAKGKERAPMTEVREIREGDDASSPDGSPKAGRLAKKSSSRRA